jgi:hypothetical protein
MVFLYFLISPDLCEVGTRFHLWRFKGSHYKIAREKDMVRLVAITGCFPCILFSIF